MHLRKLIPLVAACALAPPVSAQDAPATSATAEEDTGPSPFGSTLFNGNYAAQRENGINPDYRILSGDRVMVNAWGSVQINDVFVVDTQGNIFLPSIGPVMLAGVANDALTQTVRVAIGRVYRGSIGVYTNLITASPVAVFVTGGVRRPGRYAGIPSDSILFFLDQAGGVDPRTGSYRDVRVLRGGNEIAQLDLYDFLLHGTLDTPQLADGDAILVGRRGATVEVHVPGSDPQFVELATGELRGDQVLAVVQGGARTNAVTVRGMHEGEPHVLTLGIEEFRAAPLHDGDVISFREEGRAEQLVVRLEGETQGRTELAVRRGTRLQDLLNWIPVDPELAHTAAAHLRRPRVAQQQHQTIQDSLDRLERSAMLALSDTTGEAEIRVREAELVHNFVERARNVQPLGRVVTVSAGHQLNVLLQDGDTVVIPPRTNVVRIGGEVQLAQAVMYRPDLTVRDYVIMAGGFTNRAETDAVIVLRPNAEVMIGPADTVIQPGDEILVPPRIDRKVFQNAIDLSRIVYQIAVAASVLLRI